MVTESSVARSPEKKRLSGRTILAVVLVAIALIFVFSNLSSGPVRFLFLTFTAPTWIWFLGVLLVGVVIGSLFPWFRARKRN